MSKRSQRWPIWRIAVTAVLCLVAAGILFWLSVFLEQLGPEESGDPNATAVITLPGFILILGMGASMLGAICLVWLGLRIKEARTPPWERKKKPRRR